MRQTKEVTEIALKARATRNSDSSTPVTPTKRKSDSKHCCVTPPKMKNVENSPPLTPSTLIDKLDLSGSPEKSCKDKLGGNKYQLARRALHSSLPDKLPTREKELQQLLDFVIDSTGNDTSASLYISGPPGTGKTAALSIVLQEPTVTTLKTVFINCTKIKSAKGVYERIVKDLGLKLDKSNKETNLSAIENYLKRSRKMILLILDEIDQLDSTNQSILYTIFEWPAKFTNKIVLIGIANALDLTDRTLPRLQARCELKPKLMHFAPYSKQQIIEIFKERLTESNVVEVFSPMAIQMLAAKVAAVSGDLRRALDIGRRVVELVEQNKMTLQSLENIIETKLETVDIKHVTSVLNNVYGTTQRLNSNTEDTFPMQQKILVCALSLILKNSPNKDVTIGRLHEVYKKICRKRNLLGVDQGEFVGLCSLVETRGIIRVAGKKEPRLFKVTLEWDEEEVTAALRDKQLMSSILQDLTVLKKF